MSIYLAASFFSLRPFKFLRESKLEFKINLETLLHPVYYFGMIISVKCVQDT